MKFFTIFSNWSLKGFANRLGHFEFDDHKQPDALKPFSQLVRFTLWWSEPQANTKSFLRNLPAARLHTNLLDAAPRASQEEMYRQSYRQLLLNISEVNEEIITGIIKRLDTNYPLHELIQGVSRKEFLWISSDGNNPKFTIVLIGYTKIRRSPAKWSQRWNFQTVRTFWILLEECKFVAVDECCSTLFIFPSECESFLKYCNILSQCFAKLTNIPLSKRKSWTRSTLKSVCLSVN